VPGGAARQVAGQERGYDQRPAADGQHLAQPAGILQEIA